MTRSSAWRSGRARGRLARGRITVGKESGDKATSHSGLKVVTKHEQTGRLSE